MALLELIYTSHANETARDDVVNILASAEKNNPARAITGLLLLDGDRYIQILEGAPQQVESLFDTIRQDSRHNDIELLHKGEISGRSFENWRMAYEAIPRGLLEDLAETMGVFSMELDGQALGPGESFGARLNAMFMDAIAAE